MKTGQKATLQHYRSPCQKQIPHNKVDTLVGANSSVNGDLSFDGHCHVDGIVKGGVKADLESSSALSVSENGTVEGGVSVPYVVLNGLVRGDVVASQRVELGATARVVGNVYYNLIEMAIGAEINGKLVHQAEVRIPPETAAAEESEDAAPFANVS